MKSAWVFLLLTMVLPARGSMASRTPAELRAHLEQLKTLVAACQHKPAAATCDAGAVGQDDRVVLPDGARMVRYGWLRDALAEAGKKQKAIPELDAATWRLNRDLKELASPVQPAASKAELRGDREALHAILADGDFPPPQQESVWARLWDAFVMWLNRLLSKAGGSGTHTNWAGIILIGVVTLVACGGLVWWFRRAVRSRYVLPDGMKRGDGGRNAEKADWRAWLEEAQGLAVEERWQESIHRVYWAAVAQLESRGLWRHDAARTPREYLRLIAAESPMHMDLARLTQSLEVFWYAGRQAGRQDYEQARELLDRLVEA